MHPKERLVKRRQTPRPRRGNREQNWRVEPGVDKANNDGQSWGVQFADSPPAPARFIGKGIISRRSDLVLLSVTDLARQSSARRAIA